METTTTTTITTPTTATTSRTLKDATPNMRSCQHCGIRYDWRRSPSSCLKMTYCGSLCEIAGLGFSLESILRA